MQGKRGRLYCGNNALGDKTMFGDKGLFLGRGPCWVEGTLFWGQGPVKWNRGHRDDWCLHVLRIFAWRKGAQLLIIMIGHRGLRTGESLMYQVNCYVLGVSGRGGGGKSYVKYTSQEDHLHEYHVEGEGTVHGR